MSLRTSLISAAILLVFAGQALALKRELQMTSANLQPEGFSLTAKAGDGGVVAFQLARDLSHAREALGKA